MEKSFFNPEKGMLIVYVILVLLLLSVLGMMAITLSIDETEISSNYRQHKMLFYHADAGISATAKLVSLVLDRGAPVGEGDAEIPGIDYMASPGIFFREIMGFDHDAGTRDVTFSSGICAEVSVRRMKAAYVAGGGCEFASAASGFARDHAVISYQLDSEASIQGKDARSGIRAEYRKVISE